MEVFMIYKYNDQNDVREIYDSFLKMWQNKYNAISGRNK